MRRKLVKQGRNAMTVTLPAQWIQQHNLKAGDEVEVEDTDGRIVISGEKIIDFKKIEVNVSGLDPMIKRILGATYKSGYDEVKVTFSTIKELESIQEVIRGEFIGFEIIHHAKDHIIFKRVSTIDSEEFHTMMRRMFLIIQSMGDDIVVGLQEKNNALLSAIVLRDKDVNKIADFCRRVLNKEGSSIKGKVPPHYFMVEQLEKVGDMYRDLAKLLGERVITYSSDLFLLLEKVNLFFRQFYDLYFDFKLSDISEFGKKRYYLKEEMQKKLSQVRNIEPFFYLLSIVESVFDM